MKQSELQEIRERVDKATSGPWEHVGLRVYRAGTRRYIENEIGVANTMQDSNFFAHARDDITNLLNEVERLRKLIDSAPHHWCVREKEEHDLMISALKDIHDYPAHSYYQFTHEAVAICEETLATVGVEIE